MKKVLYRIWSLWDLYQRASSSNSFEDFIISFSPALLLTVAILGITLIVSRNNRLKRSIGIG